MLRQLENIVFPEILLSDEEQLRKLESVADLFEDANFPDDLLPEIFLKESSKHVPLIYQTIFAMETSPLLIARLTNKINSEHLANLLFHHFDEYGIPFIALMKLVDSRLLPGAGKAIVAAQINKFIEKINSIAIDKFILERKADGRSHLIMLMEYGNNASFVRFIKKANSNIVRLALLSCAQHDTKQFRIAMNFIASSAYDALLQVCDADAVVFILSKLQRKTIQQIQPEENPYIATPSLPTIDDHENEKSTELLLQEIKINNLSNQKIAKLIADNKLSDALAQIKLQYKKTSTLFDVSASASSQIPISQKLICEWEKEDCQRWARYIKEKKVEINAAFQLEVMAVLMVAIKKQVGFLPRDTQLLALLLLINTKNHGRLAQIVTGEGKTLVIAMFALIQVLQGKKPDVITSSPILALRDSQEMRPLYDYFNVTTASNWDEDPDNHGTTRAKPCYLADIVYGDAVSFQWDILRDEYCQQGTRFGRPFDIVVGDEIDCMLLDQFSQGGRLTLPKPAMEFLETLLMALWQQLNHIEHELQDANHQIHDSKQFIESALKDYAIKLISDEKTVVYVPKHLKEFALYQVDHWVNSVIEVRYRYQEGKNYLINQDSDGHRIISPVDYANTGVVQTRTVWDNGIHQFLQIKHGLRVHPESLFTCYISNLAFFNRYGSNIYGLTGTLGSDAIQQLLQTLYPVDVCFVPTFKTKRFAEEPGILVNTTEQWKTAIFNSVRKETARGRAVLIICETINAVNQIESILKQDIQLAPNIKRYARSDNNEKHAVVDQVNSGQIIIATNLAGRGTDIRTSHIVEKNGGLHVCLTFMPDNQRVEDQAFGRTSRQGNQGSGQLIVDKTQSLFSDAHDIDSMREYRDQRENDQLNRIKLFEIEKIKLKDILFSDFSSLISHLRNQTKNETLISEVEDRWGFWLKKWEDKMDQTGEVSHAKIIADYQHFKEIIEGEYQEFNYQNPCNLILQANQSSVSGMADYDRAIALDPILSVQAYYNKAFKRIREKIGNYREDALNDLAAAKLIIEEHIVPQLQAMCVVNNLNATESPTEFNKQIQTKIEIYKKQIQHINAAMEMILNADLSSELAVRQSGGLEEAYAELEASPSARMEMDQLGLNDFYAIDEIPEEDDDDDDLFGIFTVITLGVMQIAVGVACCAFPGVGTLLGSALISEGIGDILFAVRGAMEGNFSFDNYLATKTTSIAITIVTVGIDVIKLKLAEQAGKTVVKGVVKKVATDEMIKDEMIKIAKEYAVQAVITAGIKETVNLAINLLSKDMLKQFKSDIAEHVKSILLNNLNQGEAREAIDKLLFSDTENHHSHYQNQLNQLAKSILYSNQRSRSTAENILKGVISRQSSILGNVIKLADIGAALDDICHLTKSFCEDFTSAVKLFSHSLPSANKDQAQARNVFFDQLIDMMTSHIMSLLHGQVVRPATESVVDATFTHFSAQANKAKQSVQAAKAARELTIDEIERNKALLQKEEDSNNVALAALSAASNALTMKPKKQNATKKSNAQESGRDSKNSEIVPVYHFERNSAPLNPFYTVSPMPLSSGNTNDIDLQALAPGDMSYFNSYNQWERDVVSGIFRGAKTAVIGFIDDIWHPWDNIIRPIGSFLYDASVIGAGHQTTSFPALQMADPFGYDLTAMQQAIQRHPQIVISANERMQERATTLTLMKTHFMEGSAGERAEMISAMGTGFVLPGFVLKGMTTAARFVSQYKTVNALTKARDISQATHAVSPIYNTKFNRQTPSYTYDIVRKEVVDKYTYPSLRESFNFIHENPGSAVLNYSTLECMKELRQQIMVLAGPGTSFLPNDAFRTFKKINMFADVSLIGDGFSDLKPNHFQLLFKNLNNTSHDKKLLYIVAHGNVDPIQGHLMAFQSGAPAVTKDFFREVSNQLNGKPIEIFNHACHGGEANNYIDILPKGSTIISTTTANHPISTQYAAYLHGNILLNHIPYSANIVTAEKLLLSFLTSTEGKLGENSFHIYRKPVVSTTADKAKFFLDSFFSDTEKFTHNQLDQYIPKNKFYQLLDKRSLTEIPYQDLGLAYAINLSNSGHIQRGHILTLFDYPLVTAHYWLREESLLKDVSHPIMDSMMSGDLVNSSRSNIVSTAKPSVVIKPASINSFPYSKFRQYSYDMIKNQMNQSHLIERSLGLLQCVGGVAQVGMGALGGVLTMEFGLGSVVAASVATLGIDNAVAGCTQAWTGQFQSTLLNKGLQGCQFNPNQAMLAELALNFISFPTQMFSRGAVQIYQRGAIGAQLTQDVIQDASVHHVTQHASDEDGNDHHNNMEISYSIKTADEFYHWLLKKMHHWPLPHFKGMDALVHEAANYFEQDQNNSISENLQNAAVATSVDLGFIRLVGGLPVYIVEGLGIVGHMAVSRLDKILEDEMDHCFPGDMPSQKEEVIREYGKPFYELIGSGEWIIHQIKHAAVSTYHAMKDPVFQKNVWQVLSDPRNQYDDCGYAAHLFYTADRSYTDAFVLANQRSNPLHISERISGLLQCVGGVAQVGISVAGGILTIETGFGPVLAASFATLGVDNAVAGCTQALTGTIHPTLFNRGLQGLGFSENQAAVVEFGANISPLVRPALNRQLANISFFARKTVPALALTISPSTKAEAKTKTRYPTTCQRPDFEDAWKAFSTVDGYGNFHQIGNLIGGLVKFNFDKKHFKHACSVRGSYALFNAPNVKSQVKCVIPSSKGKTVSGGNGLQYFPRLIDLIDFLTHVWGPPDYDGRKANDERKLKHEKGVLISYDPEMGVYGFTGHFSLTDDFDSREARDFIFWRLPENKPTPSRKVLHP